MKQESSVARGRFQKDLWDRGEQRPKEGDEGFQHTNEVFAMTWEPIRPGGKVQEPQLSEIGIWA